MNLCYLVLLLLLLFGWFLFCFKQEKKKINQLQEWFSSPSILKFSFGF